MMKKFLVVLLLILIVCPLYSQVVFTDEKIKEVVLLDPLCDDEEGDYEWGFTVVERKECGKRLVNEFNEIMTDAENIYPQELKDNIVSYRAFLPDICVKCKDVDVLIEFSTYDVVLTYSDDESYDYILSQKGYDRLLDWCIKVFPDDEFLKKYKNRKKDE